MNYWTGKEGITFEKEFKEYIGTEHAVAVSNGTVALELALYGLNISQGAEVIIPSRTYVATASCCVARGCIPVVADVDAVTGLMTRETIEAVWTPKAKAIIVGMLFFSFPPFLLTNLVQFTLVDGLVIWTRFWTLQKKRVSK